MKVALYVRVSTQDQSCELQKRELETYSTARGWQIHSTYEDHGVSGTSTKRPMLKALMTDARSRKFDILVCWKLDRFARSLKDLLTMLQDLSDLGIAFISLKDQIDMTTASGRLMMQMIGAFGEFEAALIRERVRAGLANAKAKGKSLGRPKTRDDVAIRALRDRGYSIRKIAKNLSISKGAVQRALA